VARRAEALDRSRERRKPAKEERTIDRAIRTGLANLASHGFALNRHGNGRADFIATTTGCNKSLRRFH
jgi:hypothetical protein